MSQTFEHQDTAVQALLAALGSQPRPPAVTWSRGDDSLGAYAEARDSDGTLVKIHGPCLDYPAIERLVELLNES